MIPRVKQYKVCFQIMVICLLVVGCAPTEENAHDNVNISEQASNNESSENKSDVDKSPKQNLEVTSTEEPTKATDEASETNATPEEDVVVADEQESMSSLTDSEFYNVTEAYDATFPTLMGFTINMTMNRVIERFGEPLSETIMNDGTEPLQIYEYPGFIFGANSSNHIIFIEVNSEEVNPGLNDLRLGHTVEDARKSLGTPSSLNEYVMIYSSNQLIMKLDIDPNSSVIRSIKLFAE